jgi:peptide/nickel transport system permease protein
MDVTQFEGPHVPLPSAPEVVELTPELARKRRGQFRIITDRFLRNRVAVAGFVILVIVTLLALLAPVIEPVRGQFDPATTPNFAIALQGPSLAHPFGTDNVGRDELARWLYGARVSLEVGLFAMFASIFLGVTVGALAGFYGGWIDSILMRIVDALLAIPLYLILFLLSATFFSRGTTFGLVFLIAAFSWLYTARVVRSEFVAQKEREFLLATRTLGAGDLRLILRHIIPNSIGPIVVSATLLVGTNIITESTLSFFGFGLQPPASSWGVLLANSESYFTQQPMLVWAPGLGILLTVLAFNLMGDGLRDALDPQMTER